jgi:hypothetical protein
MPCDFITDGASGGCSNGAGREDPLMNYRLAVIVLGVLLFVIAMIPYAYKPRCADADCPLEAPYIGERGSR